MKTFKIWLDQNNEQGTNIVEIPYSIKLNLEIGDSGFYDSFVIHKDYQEPRKYVASHFGTGLRIPVRMGFLPYNCNTLKHALKNKLQVMDTAEYRARVEKYSIINTHKEDRSKGSL